MHMINNLLHHNPLYLLISGAQYSIIINRYMIQHHSRSAGMVHVPIRICATDLAIAECARGIDPALIGWYHSINQAGAIDMILTSLPDILHSQHSCSRIDWPLIRRFLSAARYATTLALQP